LEFFGIDEMDDHNNHPCVFEELRAIPDNDTANANFSVSNFVSFGQT
jgi:hypothetical protein